jgi:D-alanine--D-alanine ligase
MFIGFAFNAVRTAPGAEPQLQEELEFDSPLTISEIKKALEEMGNEVLAIEADENAYEVLKANRDKIDIVFNIAEGKYGDARESQIPLYCEVLKIPYTHSTPTTHAIALDKTFTKMLLKGEGVLVPGSVVIRTPEDELGFGLSFPLIVKPNKEGSAKGIFERNVVRDAAALEERIRFMSDNFATEVLVEEYIEGREFIVSLVGNSPPKVLPVLEQKFDFLPAGVNKFASFEFRWQYQEKLADPKTAYDCPAELSDEESLHLTTTSVKVFETLEVRDCARIDYRMDHEGNLYFIEINTLPGLNPDLRANSYLPVSAAADGFTYKELINEILLAALRRYHMIS